MTKAAECNKANARDYEVKSEHPFGQGAFLPLFLFLLCSLIAENSHAQLGSFRKLSQERSLSHIQSSKMIPVFPKDKTVIDMTVDELHRYYPSELRRLEFISDQAELNSLLKKIGEKLQDHFTDFSNTSSIESVQMQRPEDGANLSRKFNYLISYQLRGGRPVCRNSELITIMNPFGNRPQADFL